MQLLVRSGECSHDTILAENPDAAIGIIIQDEKEARLIEALPSGQML